MNPAALTEVEFGEFNRIISSIKNLSTRQWNGIEVYGVEKSSGFHTIAKIDFGLYEGGSVKYYVSQQYRRAMKKNTDISWISQEGSQ